MTDYGTNNWPSSSLGPGQNQIKKAHLFNEEHEKTYQLLGSDKVIQAYSKNVNKYRPRTLAKDPSTFAYYGKAEQYYKDSISTILDYYPFDGTRSELLSWYHSGSSLDVSLLHQEWPTSVGHIALNKSEYVLAYAGPESIPEAEYVGNYKNEFNGLEIDLDKGLTFEFWIKKPMLKASYDSSVLLEIGSFPGKTPGALNPSNLGVSISEAQAGGVNISMNIPSNPNQGNHNKASVFQIMISAVNVDRTTTATVLIPGPDDVVLDDSWHHIAIRLKQKFEDENYKIICDWFIDGKLSRTYTQPTSFFNGAWNDFSGYGSYKKYMAASLGNSLFRVAKNEPGEIIAAIDSFRVWQGLRTNKEINKYYDQKVFSSELDPEVILDSTLGLSLTFNEPTLDQAEKDKIALDYSGNEITSVIYNYNSSCRVSTSAIDLTNKSKNTEIKDPILLREHAKITSLQEELIEIAKSYDRQNFNLLRNYLPDWTHSDLFGKESKEEMDFLLHLMATTFDSIKKNLDSMRKLTRPEYEESSIQTELLSSYNQQEEGQSLAGVSSALVPVVVPAQNKIDFAKKVLENYGFDQPEYDLFWTLTSQEVIESLVGNIKFGNTIEETKSIIFDCLANAASFILNKKGTKTAFTSILNAAGLGDELISINLYGQNAQIKVEEKTEVIAKKIKSLNFLDNPSANAFCTNPIPTNNQIREFTLEGTFIFPEPSPGKQHTILDSSVFGASPYAFTVTAVKQSYFSNNAKFTLKFHENNVSNFAAAGVSNMETSLLPNVYDSNPWHLAVTVFKDVENKFFDTSTSNYKIGFYGHKVVSGEVIQSFEVIAELDHGKYGVIMAHPMSPFVGARRTDNNGNLQTSTDIRVLNLSMWDTALTKEELQNNAATISSYGVANYGLKDDMLFSDPSNRSRGEKQVFKIQFDSLTAVNAESTTILDMLEGTDYRLASLGSRIGTSHNFETFGFSQKLDNTITQDFLSSIKKVPILNLQSAEGIEIKEQEIDKFDLKTKPQRKILSFEKSMYSFISSEMTLFLSNLTNFNELIGSPVNKYRKNYKSLNSLRQRFFSIVEETSQVEKFVNYYRWIDKAVGHFLRQITPASLQVNSNIENVIESHILERPKVDHKLTRIKNFSSLTDTIVSAHGLAANSYPWSEGHHSESENENPIYDIMRLEVDADRQGIRNVVNGIRNLTGNQFTNFQKLSQESLSKVYRESASINTIIKMGNNSDSSVELDHDFYKLLAEGLGLEITQDSFEPLHGTDVGKNNEINVRVFKGTSEEQDGSYGKNSLPFTFKEDSSSNDLGDFKPGVKIVNSAAKSESLQGPWVKENVGFYPHRRVKIGTESDDRPEAYRITTNASTGKMTVKKEIGQMSLIKRDLASSVYNIKNVKTDQEKNKIGNFQNSYEIIQAVGADSLKKEESKNLKEKLSISSHVEGLIDHPVIHGTGKKQKSVFVSRFSASGGTANFGQDIDLGEMSVYNSINYRNLLLRAALDCMSVESAGKNGRRKTPGSAGQEVGSIHKVPKNSSYMVRADGNKVVDDNFFVQTHLPQTDFSYSWVKKATTDSIYDFIERNQNSGHQNTFETLGDVSSGESIDFLRVSSESSDLDFLGLNLVNEKTLDETNNIVISSASDLNTILLNNSGQYGWPSWKQIRNQNNPIVKSERKNNILSISMRGEEANARVLPGLDFDYGNTIEDKTPKNQPRVVRRFEEMPVTSRYSPVMLTIVPNDEEGMLNSALNKFTEQQNEFFSWKGRTTDIYKHDYIGPKKITILTSPQNSVTGFSNEELSNVIGFREKRLENTDSLQALNYFIETIHSDESSLLSLVNSKISYKEKIYPREINSFRQKIRKRTNFEYFPWNSNRLNRQITLRDNITYGNYYFTGVNLLPSVTVTQQEEEFTKTYFNLYDSIDLNSVSSSGATDNISPIISSSWPLDSRRDFAALPCDITDTFFSSPSNFMANRSQGTRGEGILQNDYSLFPLGINLLHGAPPLAPVLSRRVPFAYNSSTYLAGEAKWEAADTRTVGPFYDSYDNFSEQSQILGRQYSLVPEFRVSKFVEKLFNQENIESLTNGMENFLEIVGVDEDGNSSSQNFFKTYSNSDFLKYFDLVHNNAVIAEKGFEQDTLTLRCKAIKKFLPYRGFYPAERVVELANIFNRCYLKDDSYDFNLLDSTMYASNLESAATLLKARIQNSKAQAIKPLLAPGVIMNSIKAGVAVDYPVFASNPTAALQVIYDATDDNPATMFSTLSSIGSDTNLPFKGTEINGSADSGIPRINGQVSTRINFDDVMNPENLFSTIIHDNEPHPAATSLYGSNLHFPILERPATFGTLNKEETLKYTAIEFSNTREKFQDSIRPFKSAVNNFASETVNFFLEESKLTSLVSRATKPKLKKGVEYKMFVYLENKNTIMYDRHSAFGPPVDEGTINIKNYSVSQNSSAGAASTATINFTGQSLSSLLDQTVTIVDYQNLSKTYVFKQDTSSTSATPATGQVQIDSLTLNGATFTMVDAESSPTSKTYKFETSAASTGAAAFTEIVINAPSKPGGYNTNSSFAGESNYPYLEVTDESSSTHRIRFMNSISGSYMANSTSATNVSYVDLYNSSLSRYKTSSELIADIKSELESNLAVAVSEPSTATMRITLSALGVPSNASITSGNCFINSSTSPCTAGNNISENSSLSAFSGGSASVPASGTISEGNVIININAMSTSAVLAEMRSVIVSSTGHNGTISVSVDTSNSRVDLTQATAGTSGNNGINKSGTNSSNLTVVGFSQGTAAVSGVNYTTGQILGSNVVVDITGMSSVSNIASELMTAIGSSNGHSTEIVQDGDFNSSTEVLTIKQNSVGTVGDKTNNSTVSNFVSNFTSGADATSATFQTLEKQTTQLQNSHGYLPFVPPFLDPGTSPYVEISFTASENREYTIPEIIEGSTKTFYNVEAPSNASDNCNYSNAMNIEASLDLDNYILEADSSGPQNDKYRWVIQTKWETPILNFKNTTSSVLNLSTNQIESVSDSPWKPRSLSDYYSIKSNNNYLPSSKGIWHQLGTLQPENSTDGYMLSVSGPAETSSIKDLSKILEFSSRFSKPEDKQSQVKLGKISKSKQLCEAVVAIPYYLDENNKIRLLETAQKYANVPVNQLISNSGYSNSIIRDSFARQQGLMNKYVIPPQFDFIRNPNVKPHVQYIFEFKMDLDQQDLSDIWQNLYPENSIQASKTRRSSTFKDYEDQQSTDREFYATNINPMNPSLFKDSELFKKEKIRWIVFKAKYRGINDYSFLKLSSTDVGTDSQIIETSFGSDNSTGNEVKDQIYSNYGYNWPYDYFSIVELVDLSAKVDFSITQATTLTYSDLPSSEECSDQQNYQQQLSSSDPDSNNIINNYITVEGSSSSGDNLSNTQFTQTVKHVGAAIPTPANQATVSIPDGYSIKTGSVSIYLNGVLLIEGSSNDYTMSSNVITLNGDLLESDSLTIKYKLQENT